ncbi:MAG: hypothetical protein JWR51_2123 [Devosia sp.]|uniref:DUF2147 domain-containing protein n=1 Tax=Devosia sp. TaxID=1871048 RepID=UPI00261036FB|nr:DUF2147 domain-containing protein [Devosia sp.]MDB5529020.1 hypothetical protein [Devosia sp.]
MRGFGTAIVAVGLAAASVMPAWASPNGVWELETRDTRIALQLCGDGTKLCGTLVWLSDADYNEQYKKYLNTPVTTGMSAAGNGKWKGKLRLLGYDMSGSITQQSEDHMTLSGCALLVVCKTYQMYRHDQ